MTVTAIVGANWGDEGKGKMIDTLAAKADYVVRFQGGNNAGHTVINDHGRFALHLLPSGVFYPHVVNVLGPGVAVNLRAFFKEYDELLAHGIAPPKIKVSDRAQVVLPYHILFDELEEERLQDRKFGSTKSGIAPFYSDKYLKIGVQVADLFNEKTLAGRINQALEQKNVLLTNLYHKEPLRLAEILQDLKPYIQRIEPFVCDTTELLHQAVLDGKQIFLEGQLGALRDPDHGVYPYSTSSSTLAGFAPIGAGIPPYSISRIIAVVKSYSSCVGAGPFVTEIFGEEGHTLREAGGDRGEYGATTGRPRRMGWFDAVATRYGCQIQGATEVALTLLDVLKYRSTLPVCVAYSVRGKVVNRFPATSILHEASPIYKELPGWQQDISSVRTFSALPKEARDYVDFLQEQIQLPIKMISVGPHRDSIIHL